MYVLTIIAFSEYYQMVRPLFPFFYTEGWDVKGCHCAALFINFENQWIRI